MEKVLPMGSIVYLKGGNQKVMILNRGPQVEIKNQRQLFDYSAAVYPMGLSPEKIIYFNSKNIDKVLFEGFSDEEEVRFQELYKKWLDTEGKNVEKGNIEQTLKN